MIQAHDDPRQVLKRMLANGPMTLLRRYAEVAAAHGVDTHLTVSGPGRNGLCVLELGETYVIAERFTAA